VSAGVRQPISRWKRLFCYILFGLVSLAILLFIWRFTLNRLITAEISAIRERSYPVTLAELNRWYPRVSPGENRAIVLGKAFTSLAAQFNSSPQAVTPSQTSEEYLNGNSAAISLLHEASLVPRSRFPIDLGIFSIRPYPHLAGLIRSAHLLETEAANHTDCDNAESACLSVQSLFALSHSLVKEPLVRSHLVRLECQRIALGSLQDMLNRTDLTDVRLNELDSILEKADDQHALARAFIGQRCIGIYSFDELDDILDLTALPVARSRPFSQRLFINLDVLLSSPSYLYGLCGLLQWDELNYLQLMDRYIQTAQMAFPERVGAAQELRHSLEQQSKLHTFSRGWLHGMNGPRVVMNDTTVTTRLRAARTAIAIERFRLTHGQLPVTLAELDPFGLGAVPIDPFSGQALRYKRLAKGYVVYSIGEDEKDDAGDEKKDVTFIVER
jgi:hypothetical protein